MRHTETYPLVSLLAHGASSLRDGNCPIKGHKRNEMCKKHHCTSTLVREDAVHRVGGVWEGKKGGEEVLLPMARALVWASRARPSTLPRLSITQRRCDEYLSRQLVPCTKKLQQVLLHELVGNRHPNGITSCEPEPLPPSKLHTAWS